MLETVDQAPEAFGYDFGRWTGERLATYLAEKTGIILSGSQVRRILKRKKFSYIWSKYSLEDKQDSDKRAEFKEKLAKYLAMTKEHPQRLQIWFWDETGFSLRVIRRKCWGKRGQRKKITGQRGHGRVNVMGASVNRIAFRVCFFIQKGNADTFYEQVEQLHECVKHEWIAQGHSADQFQQHGPKIIMILDNASYPSSVIFRI